MCQAHQPSFHREAGYASGWPTQPGSRPAASAEQGKSGWDRTHIVKSGAGHLCLVDDQGLLIALADTVPQLLDVIDFGGAPNQDSSVLISCALVSLAAASGAHRCHCGGERRARNGLPAPGG